MRRVVAALLLVGTLMLAGCSAISAGTITSKDHREGYYTPRQQCVSYDKNSLCRQYIFVQDYTPPSWKFSLRDGEDTGWAYVSEDTYNRYQVGDFFDADR